MKTLLTVILILFYSNAVADCMVQIRENKEFRASFCWEENEQVFYTVGNNTIGLDKSIVKYRILEKEPQVTQSPYNNPSPTQYKKNPSPVQETRVKESANSISYDGTGNTVSKSFRFSGGRLDVTSEHHGKKNFVVWLKDSQTGRNKALLANKVGFYVGQKSESLKPGDYYLEITADGGWRVTMTHPTR